MNRIVARSTQTSSPGRMRPIRSLASCLVGVAIGCSPGLRESSAQPLSACGGSWTKPEPVQIESNGRAVARWPSISEMSGEIVLAGNNVQRMQDPLTPSSAIVWSSSRGILGLPRRSSSKVLPRVVLDSGGSVHLFWGEAPPERSMEVSRSLQFQTSLWWSPRSSSDREWGPTREILSGSRVDWRLARTHRGRDGRSVFVVAMAAKRGAHRPEIVFLKFDGTAWTSRPIPETIGAVYTAIVEDSTGRLYVPFIAAVRDTVFDANSVFVTTSDDGGMSWSAPLILSRSGIRQAFDIAAVATEPNVIRLVWAQNRSGGLVSEVVRTMSTNDGGITWSRPQDLEVTPGFSSLIATADACGALHVIFSDNPQGGDAGHLDHAVFDTTWHNPVHLFPETVALDAEFLAAPGGTLELFFVELDRDSVRSMRAQFLK